MQFFDNHEKARFVSRSNRFTLKCNLDGRVVEAYLPNTGRLQELLLPNAEVYLEKNSASHRKLRYTAVAVERGGVPVMLHTHKTNEAARYLIERDLIPGLEGARIIKSEVKWGSSRFDFLLKKDRKNVLLEVKSCTLFSKNVAMFPDAVTVRGRRHVEELMSLSKQGIACAVLFIVHAPKVKMFMPDYHTDLLFSRSLIAARDRIKVIPVAVGWNRDLSLKSEVRLLEVPWDVVLREAVDRGCYLIILRLVKGKAIEVGRLGKIDFRAGYYVYVGSDRRNLSKRIGRHRRKEKKEFWHIDYLRRFCEFHADLPIRTKDDIECEVASAVKVISDFEVSWFGSSDCSCASHLFYMRGDPLNSPSFHKMLQHWRMERPVKDYI